MNLVLKNGTIVTASDLYSADLGIQDGAIAMIDLHLEGDDGRRL